MFKNTREVLDKMQSMYDQYCTCFKLSEEEADLWEYFDMYLAKALMKDKFVKAEKVAKIILATKGLSSEIKVKVE